MKGDGTVSGGRVRTGAGSGGTTGSAFGNLQPGAEIIFAVATAVDSALYAWDAQAGASHAHADQEGARARLVLRCAQVATSIAAVACRAVSSP